MTSAFPETVAASTPSLLFQEGDPVTAGFSGHLSRIACASLDDDGKVALSAGLSGSDVRSALFLRSKNGLQTLLRAGEAAPCGGWYKRFSDLDLSSFPQGGAREVVLAFRAELEGCAAREGLFLWDPDGVQTIALAATKTPRGGTFRSFARPTVVAVRARSGPGFILAYEAALEAGGRSVVVHPSYAHPLETLATGDRLGDAEVVGFSLSRMGGCVGSVVRLRDEDGKTANEVAFVKHGLTIHGWGLREGLEFPSLGVVRRIAGPPAIALQICFVAVEFAGSASALVTSDVLGNAQIFARSGDVSPDRPDDPIESFGPPIANAVFPVSGSPIGVVAPVRLRSGQRALWSAAFTDVLPLRGQQRLLPLEKGTEPVKLTNQGTLLLRSRKEGRGECWTMIDGLFGPR